MSWGTNEKGTNEMGDQWDGGPVSGSPLHVHFSFVHFSFVSDHVHFTSPITLNICKMVNVFMSPSPLINVICRPSKQMPYTLWILEDAIDVWIFLISMFISFLNTKRQGKCHPMLQRWSFWRAGVQYSPHLKNIPGHQNGGYKLYFPSLYL